MSGVRDGRDVLQQRRDGRDGRDVNYAHQNSGVSGRRSNNLLYNEYTVDVIRF